MLGRYLNVDHFALTLAAALLGVLLFFIWALWRSPLPPYRAQEFRGQLPTMGATYTGVARIDWVLRIPSRS